MLMDIIKFKLLRLIGIRSPSKFIMGTGIAIGAFIGFGIQEHRIKCLNKKYHKLEEEEAKILTEIINNPHIMDFDHIFDHYDYVEGE
jgi:hypothetical protein